MQSRQRFVAHILAATALAAASLPASAYVVGDGILQGDIYSEQGASGKRTFSPFFEEVFVIPNEIWITQESSLSGEITTFGSAALQHLNIFSVSVSTGIVPSSTSPSLLAVSSTPSHYTFESLAPGHYYLQVHGQVILDNGVDYETRPDWSLGFNMTALAAPVASPAPDAAPLLLTALGLAGVAYRARRMASRRRA